VRGGCGHKKNLEGGNIFESGTAAMSHNQRRGGISLFASSKPTADDDSDSSDDAPIPQKFQKRPKRVQSSESSELESDSEDGSSEVGSSDDSSESDESLEVRFCFFAFFASETACICIPSAFYVVLCYIISYYWHASSMLAHLAIFVFSISLSGDIFIYNQVPYV
jgi:hypothetical protein